MTVVPPVAAVLGLNWHEISRVDSGGVLEQEYITAKAVVLETVLTNGIGDPPPANGPEVGLATEMLTVAVPPIATGNVMPVVELIMNAWLVAVTVRFTVVFTVTVPLVPETVMVWALGGNVMLAAVATVRTTLMVWAGMPSSVTLVGLKLQSAPAGTPAVQPPGAPKFTVPVNPVVGVTVIVCVAVCPAGTVRLIGLADMEYGAVMVTVAGDDVEGALMPL